MSIIFPENPKFKTNGEKNLYDNILKQLSDDWYIFYEPFINGNKPDFVLFNQNYGLAIIEVKDYVKSTIVHINPIQWEIISNGIIKKVTSPLEQATNYRNELINKLSVNESLLIKTGEFKGRLKVPVYNFCCFPALNQEDVKYLNIITIIPEDLIICKNDMVDIQHFLEKIFSPQHRLFKPSNISENDINDILKCIFPTYHVDLSYKVRGESFEHLPTFITIKNFENYVEELFFITDQISNLLNNNGKKPHEFIIVYNEQRASVINSKKYVDTLINMLNHKNLSFSLHNEKSDCILLTSYKEFINFKLESKIVFLSDYKLIANSIKQNLIKLITQLSQSEILFKCLM